MNFYLSNVGLAGLALLLVSCGTTTPRPPEWRGVAQDMLNDYVQLRLEGQDVSAARTYATAIERVRDGGDLNGLHIVILTHCAMDIALLKDSKCDEFSRRAIDAGPENMAYYDLLRGKLPPHRVAELPQRYRELGAAITANQQHAVTAALRRIEDPVSRVVATGITWQAQRLEETALEESAQIARVQGWRAAHRIYEETRAQSLENAGRKDEAARTRARMQALFATDIADTPQ